MEVESAETSVFHVFFSVSEPVEDTENTETEQKKTNLFSKTKIFIKKIVFLQIGISSLFLYAC